MADFYLHCYVASCVKNQMNRQVDSALLYLSSQGPDPFYYDLNKTTTASSIEIVNLCHQEQTQLFLTALVKEVKNNLTQESYTFLVGQLCHYVLDKTIHPYIFYHSGVYHSDQPETSEFKGLHLKFERSVDYEFIRLYENTSPDRYNFNQKYFPKFIFPSTIDSLMINVVNQVYQKNIELGRYKHGITTMKKVLKRYAYDPYGFKKRFFLLQEKMTKNHQVILSDVSMYQHTSNFDFLNMQHQVWHHPVTNLAFSLSVPELVEKAITETVELMNILDSYLFEYREIDFSQLFPNISYNSGSKCSDQMKYFKNYLSK